MTTDIEAIRKRHYSQTYELATGGKDRAIALSAHDDRAALLSAYDELLRKYNDAVAAEREAIIQFLPGGQFCDPQQIADAIRARSEGK